MKITLLVYTLINAQSDTPFILEDTMKKLDISGPEVTLSLSTMFAEDKIIQSVRASGFS